MNSQDRGVPIKIIYPEFFESSIFTYLLTFLKFKVLLMGGEGICNTMRSESCKMSIDEDYILSIDIKRISQFFRGFQKYRYVGVKRNEI
jgi:hypothetical protein